jgi:hypothetical protein
MCKRTIKTCKLLLVPLIALATSLTSFTNGALPVMALKTDSLNSQIASVIPTAEEDRWLAIPWRTDIMQARLEAQRYNRPLFLWVMNGHPMGCT